MQIPEPGINAEPSGSVTETLISGVRGATGPRTQRGKQKSKSNALKHGIFSKAVLLKEEPRAEFDSLLRGLRNDCKPEGTLEELLVDNLAVISWRKRRLLIAERAEIRKGTEFVDSDIQQRSNDEFAIILQEGCPLGEKLANPRALNACIELLTELKNLTEGENLNEMLSDHIIRLLCGKNGSENLLALAIDGYLKSMNTTRSDASVDHRPDSADLAKHKHDLLSILEGEIRRLKHIQCDQMLNECKRIEIEWHRGNVPEAPMLDRLLRYETTLQRDFDRTLSQLERQQRIRKGEPVSPTLDVHVS
jgi:hypothetical protein